MGNISLNPQTAKLLCNILITPLICFQACSTFCTFLQLGKGRDSSEKAQVGPCQPNFFIYQLLPDNRGCNFWFQPPSTSGAVIKHLIWPSAKLVLLANSQRSSWDLATSAFCLHKLMWSLPLACDKQTRDGILLLIGYLFVFILVLLPKMNYKHGPALLYKGLKRKLPFPAKLG